jgi:hypothetical protein
VPWSDNPRNSSSFVVSAAKVPSSYPYPSCKTVPPKSTADPDSDEQWKVDLAPHFNVVRDDSDPENPSYTLEEGHFYFFSRSVHIDDEQTHVAYGLTAQFYDDVVGVGGGDNWEGDGILDIYQVNISAQTAVYISLGFLGYAIDDWDDRTLMEGAFNLYHRYFNTGFPDDFTTPSYPLGDYPATFYGQRACNDVYFGSNYYFSSTYTPNIKYGPGTSAGWDAARVFYNFDGDRPVAYATYHHQQGIDNASAYAIALPSRKAWLLTEPPEPPDGDFSTIESRTPDEPWVIGIRLDGTVGLATGRSFSTTMAGDYWDGILAEEEVANVLIPLDVEHPLAAELNSAEDIRIRSYEHLNGKDLVLLTTLPSDPGDQTAFPTSDFGVDDGTADLNHDLPAGNPFEIKATHFGDTVDVEHGWYLTPVTDAVVDTHKWAASFHSSPAEQNRVSLIRKINVIHNGSQLVFDYRLDNSARATADPFAPPLNFPADDGAGNHDTAELWIDGVLKWSDDNTVPVNGTAGTSEPFFGFYSQNNGGARITITDIAAGEHTVRFTLNRVTTLNQLKFYLDNIDWPEELISNDYNGQQRYFYDGATWRRANHWKWALWEDETNGTTEGVRTEIPSRQSTAPDCITMDRTHGNEGKILYGNEQYITRVIVDGIDNTVYPNGKLDTSFADKGFWRATASPVIPLPTRFFSASCEWVDILVHAITDAVADGEWGQMMIIPTRGAIHLRGMNSSVIRDATVDPVQRDLYPDEEFVYKVNAGKFSDRVSCLTLKDDGHTVLPHVEVIWRPNMDRESFPVAPDPELPPEDDGYLTPPWPYGMQQDSHVLRDHAMDSPPQWARPDFSRIRDPIRFGKSDDNDVRITNKPIWNHLSTIVPRIYADTYSHRPQYIWMRLDIPDPTDPEDPIYNTYPYPSVNWKLVPTFGCPTPGHQLYYYTSPNINECHTCQSSNPDDPNYDEFCNPDNFHYTWSIGDFVNGGCTDFDAVDCDCDCCAENNFEPPV